MAAMADDDIADCNGLSWSELATKLDLKSSDCKLEFVAEIVDYSYLNINLPRGMCIARYSERF